MKCHSGLSTRLRPAAFRPLAVSDDPVLASRCDRILVLKEGKVIQEGTFAEIRQSVHYSEAFKIHPNI